MIEPKFLQKTIEFWEPRASRQLTEVDACMVIENVNAFFSLLERWVRDEEKNAYTQILFWMDEDPDDPIFELENWYLTRLIMLYNVYDDGKKAAHSQEILDRQTSSRLLRSDHGDPPNLG